VVKCAQPHQLDAGVHCCSILLCDAVQLFVLANILRRPVVVLCHVTSDVSDPSQANRPYSKDIGGIYLPLLWKPTECFQYPVVLSNVDGKFIPLIGGNGTSDMPSALDVVPLVTAQFEPLRVWFLLDEEEREVHSLFARYMSITEVNLCQAQSISMVISARLKYRQLEQITSSAVTHVISASEQTATIPTETCQNCSSLTHLAETVIIGTSQQPGAISVITRSLIGFVIIVCLWVLVAPSCHNCVEYNQI